MKSVLVAVLAASMLTVVGGSVSPADAVTPCAAATTNRALSTWLPGGVTTPTNVDYFRFTTTSSEWALIKLGGLTADLQLKLYDSSCHLITTSQHAATHFEQIYRSLSAGRYYLGVSGVSGATSAYQVKFTPLSEGTHVLSSRLYDHPQSDGIQLDGEALNNRSYAWFFSYGKVAFLDSAGHSVATTEVTFPQQYAHARSRVPFTVWVSKPTRAYVRYTVTLVTSSVGGNRVAPPARIVPSPSWVDIQGNRHYPGSVTNTSKSIIDVPGVVATLYDTYGNVRYVGRAFVVPDDLRPNETGGYDIGIGPVTGVNGGAWLITD